MHKKEHDDDEALVSHTQETKTTNTDVDSQLLQDSSSKKEDRIEHETTKTPPIWKRCWNSCRSLHIGWILSIALFIALITIVVCYESKLNHMKTWWQTNSHHFMIGHPYYWFHRSQWWYRVDPFEEIYNTMEAMERRHQDMMSQLFLQLPQPSHVPSQTISGHYSGYRDANNGFIRYSIDLNSTAFRGNILTSSGAITHVIKNSLEEIWVKTQANGNQLAISGNANTLSATIKILDNK